MGRLQAEALAAEDFLPLENQIQWHLASNHYPAIPAIMVEPCIEAIDNANEGEWDKTITLPEGVSWKGLTEAPTYAIVEAHHLDAWIIESELY